MDKSEAVREVFVRYIDALARRDIEAIDALISDDEAVLVVGSDPIEWYQSHDAAIDGLRAIFDQVGGLPVEPNEPQAYASGELGWVVDRPKVNIPSMDMDFRMSMVLSKEGGDWKIIHLHASRSIAAESRPRTGTVG